MKILLLGVLIIALFLPELIGETRNQLLLQSNKHLKEVVKQQALIIVKLQHKWCINEQNLSD